MAGLADYQTALAMREIIKDLVAAEVEKQRPRYQMATVTSIDRVNRKCTVQFPGDTTTATVSMGSLQPTAVGQVVRVEGLLGDRFIADVMGAAYNTLETRVSAIEAAPAGTSNFCTNPGFESMFDQWSGFWSGGSGTHSDSIDTVAANAYEGNNSCKVTLVGDNSNYKTIQHAAIPIVAGEVIFFSWRERAVGANMQTYAEIVCGPDDPNANYFGTGAVSVGISDPVAVANGGGYVIRKGMATMPVGKTFGRFAVRVNATGAVNGSVWLDDFKFQRLALANPADPITFTGTTQFTGPTWAWAGMIFPTVGDTLKGAGWQNLMQAMRAQTRMLGGGVRGVTSAGVNWSQRIIGIALGKAPTTGMTSGYFQIDMPADGTVITGYGGATNKTVAGGYIPTSAWDALYYDPPFGGAGAFDATRLKVVNYTGDYVVPNEWILVVQRNADTGKVLWWDGRESDYWRVPTMGASWVNYGSTWDGVGYKCENGIVFLKGLIKSGADATTIFSLPAGYRPIGDEVFTGVVNVVTSGAASTGTAHTHPIQGSTRLDIFAATGNLQTTNALGGNGYVSLSNISFPVGG